MALFFKFQTGKLHVVQIVLEAMGSVEWHFFPSKESRNDWSSTNQKILTKTLTEKEVFD